MANEKHKRDWRKFLKTLSAGDVAAFERQRLEIWRGLPFVKAVSIDWDETEGGEVMTVEYVAGAAHGKCDLLFWEASRELQARWMGK